MVIADGVLLERVGEELSQFRRTSVGGAVRETVRRRKKCRSCSNVTPMPPWIWTQS